MKYVPGAFNAAMAHAEGRFAKAAEHLAARMEWDDDLRAEAATLLVACLLEPARTAHAQEFQRDTGRTVEEFVAKHTPSVEVEP